MSTSISIKGKTQGNESVTTTINYVNPSATNNQLQSLASAFNNLTTNTITDVSKITKESLTATKLSRNMILTDLNETIPSAVNMSVPYTKIGTDAINQLFLILDGTFDPDQLIVNCTGGVANGDTYILISLFTEVATDETSTSFVLRREGNSSVTATYTITMPADSVYDEGVVTLTVTAS